MCEISALVIKSKSTFACPPKRRMHCKELSRNHKVTFHKRPYADFSDCRIKYIFYNLSILLYSVIASYPDQDTDIHQENSSEDPVAQQQDGERTIGPGAGRAAVTSESQILAAVLEQSPSVLLQGKTVEVSAGLTDSDIWGSFENCAWSV